MCVYVYVCITKRLQNYWIDWPEQICHLILHFPEWFFNKKTNAKIKQGCIVRPLLNLSMEVLRSGERTTLLINGQKNQGT